MYYELSIDILLVNFTTGLYKLYNDESEEVFKNGQ